MIEKFEGPKDRPLGSGPLAEFQFVATPYLAFLQYTIVPASPPCLLNTNGYISALEISIHSPAWLTALANLKLYTTNLIDITEAHILFGKSKRRNIFAKARWIREQRSKTWIFGHPGSIVLAWIVMKRLVRPAVPTQIPLMIPHTASCTYPPRSGHGGLAYSASDPVRTQRGQGAGI